MPGLVVAHINRAHCQPKLIHQNHENILCPALSLSYANQARGISDMKSVDMDSRNKATSASEIVDSSHHCF
jgi:hypothetical protein